MIITFQLQVFVNKRISDEKIDSDTFTDKTDETKSLVENVPTSDKRVFASPLAKKIAAEKNIDLSTVVGSGDNGRIVKSDLDNIALSSIEKPKTD